MSIWATIVTDCEKVGGVWCNLSIVQPFSVECRGDHIIISLDPLELRIVTLDGIRRGGLLYSLDRAAFIEVLAASTKEVLHLLARFGFDFLQDKKGLSSVN